MKTGPDHGDRPLARPGGTRSPVLAQNGMVATSHPLASATALHVLRERMGHAVDAAIAAAAVLAVVEPTMTGIGGDMFVLVSTREAPRPVALNASGWSGSKARLESLPGSKALSPIQTVTVPGAVAGWFKLHARYGRVPMSELLAPAIAYAEDGFPVAEIVSSQWARAGQTLGPASVDHPFFPGGRAPSHGEIFRNPDLARSLSRLAVEGPEAFYQGEIAKAIVRSSDALGGFLTLDDFRDFDAAWVEPLSTDYRGHTVYELPPNAQGLTALEMLNLLEGFDLAGMGHNSLDYIHTIVEAKTLAFADRDRYVADPGHAEIPIERLISKQYAERRRREIDPERSRSDPRPGIPARGDTVYFAIVDRERNAVSFINSLFESFGSGIVVDGTGICLHNRGRGFSLDPGHPNCLAPRKRPLHTLIPAMVTRSGELYLSFGVMGGDMQAQGHVQVLANLIDFGMDVQQAGEVPRFRHDPGGLALESSIPPEVRKGLRARAHKLIDQGAGFGGYQGILIDPESGVLGGGSDPRKDGLAIGW